MLKNAVTEDEVERLVRQLDAFSRALQHPTRTAPDTPGPSERPETRRDRMLGRRVGRLPVGTDRLSADRCAGS